MFLGFSVFGCSEQEGVGTSWCGHDQLIKGEAFSSGFDNLSSGGFGESKGSDGHLCGFHTSCSNIIGDSSDNNGGFSLSFK